MQPHFHLVFWVMTLCATAITSPCVAQNVTNYGELPDPYLYLFLLREPAVQQDLQLTVDARRQLIQLNGEIDGPLLALRNWETRKAQKKLQELFNNTQQRCAEILNDEQRRRLEQIMMRVRGIRSIQTPSVAAKLKLTTDQRERIDAIVQKTSETLGDLRQRLQAGEAEDQINQLALEARRTEQREVVNELTAEQQRELMETVGPVFDLSQLGQVTFKAPELAKATTWINSGPLELAKLKGNVVALHFWAFGCVNCQRNYPWYRGWQESFADQDFEIIGIHTPETSREREVDQLRAEVAQAGFEFPVVVDNDNQNWNAWGNSMWPSVYLIDKQGNLRYWWYGELNWQGREGEKLMRRRIQELIAESN